MAHPITTPIVRTLLAARAAAAVGLTLYPIRRQPMSDNPPTHRLVALRILAATMFVSVAVAPATVGAAVINVPTDQPTIQAGIDAAEDGDEVVVAAGTYVEAIDFLGKAITVRSASGDPADTIIDGNGAFHVVTCDSGEGPDTVLDGLTITGGNANGSSPDNLGGGMYIVSSSPTATNCVISGNSADAGGGMSISQGSPTVVDCKFSGNSALHGGGIYVLLGTVTVANCTFSANSAVQGGGMYNFYSTTTVNNCTFDGNTGSSGGGGMYNDNVYTSTVTNCTFSGNAGNLGGGIYNYIGGPSMTNCAFSGNTVSHEGGGLYNNTTNQSQKLINCTFSGNAAGNSGGAMYNYLSSPTVTNAVSWNNTPDEINGIGGSAAITFSNIHGGFAGAGNIDADPLFADADGADNIAGTLDDDLRLTAGSPCIDAGDDGAVPAGVTTDLDGNPRFVDDPDTTDTGVGGPPIVDMGAYEFQTCPADLSGNGTVDPADLAALLGAWGACPGCPEDLNEDGAVNAGDLAILLGAWGGCP